MAFKRPQNSEKHASHHRRPNELVSSCLDEDCLRASGIVRLDICIQDSVPPMADRSIKKQAIGSEAQTPAHAMTMRTMNSSLSHDQDHMQANELHGPQRDACRDWKVVDHLRTL